MRKKIEIKVYLPYMMVGELESRRKANQRSKFIEDAIRAKLDGEEAFRLRDVQPRRLLTACMASFPDNNVFRTMCLELMEECE